MALIVWSSDALWKVFLQLGKVLELCRLFQRYWIFFFFSSTRIFQFNPFVYEIPRFMMLKRSIFFFCWDKEISCFVWSKRDIQYSKLLINLKLNLFIVIFVGNACRKDIVARGDFCYFPSRIFIKKNLVWRNSMLFIEIMNNGRKLDILRDLFSMFRFIIDSKILRNKECCAKNIYMWNWIYGRYLAVTSHLHHHETEIYLG